MHGAPPSRDLAETLAALLGARVTPGGTVSVASVRAVHRAFGQETTNLVRVAEAHGATIDGDHVALPASAPTALHPDAHLDVAAALCAGTAQVLEVLPDLTAHAARAPSGPARAILTNTLSSVRGARASRVLDLLEQVGAELPDSSATARWLAERVLVWRNALGDRPDAPLRSAEDVATAHLRAGDPQGAARVVAEILRAEGTASDVRLVQQVVEWNQDGWGHALMSVARHISGASDETLSLEDRLALQLAMRTDDPQLACRSLVALAIYHADRGAADDAVAWAERGVDTALRSFHWRDVVLAYTHLVRILVSDLRLATARTRLDEVLTIARRVELPGLSERVAVVACSFGLTTGRSEYVEQLDLDASAPIDGQTWDVLGELTRARALHVRGDPRAIEVWRLAATILEGSGMSRYAPLFDLHLTLLECSLFPQGGAWERLPGALGSMEPATEAQALTQLARHVVLDDAPSARDVLRAALEAVSPERSRILALAAMEAEAIVEDDWRSLDEARRRWDAHGFEREAALCGASAAVLAGRRNDAHAAEQGFDVAHGALARLGCVGDLALVRAARERAGSLPRRLRRAPARHGFAELLGTDPALRERIESFVVRRVVPLGADFPIDFACTVLSGAAAIYVDERDAPVAVVGAGEIVGLERAIPGEGGASSSSAFAITPCTVGAIPIDALTVEVARSSTAAGAIAKYVLETGRRDVQHARDLMSKPVEARVASVLARCSVTSSTGEPLELRLPRAVLANLVGASREAVSRAITRLAGDDLLVVRGQVIGLRSVEGLVRRATGAAGPS